MKKTILVFALIIMIFSLSAVIAGAEKSEAAQDNYIYGSELNDGVYNISVKSSSSMFRIINCDLNVSDGEMTAELTLSGKGYEKLFMGTGDEALKSDDESFIHFTENSEGKYIYTVPVEALDKEIDCAAWSIKKQKWYDRVLVFESDGLPEDAFAKDSKLPYAAAGAAAFLAAGFIVIIIVTAVNKKKHTRPE